MSEPSRSSRDRPSSSRSPRVSSGSSSRHASTSGRSSAVEGSSSRTSARPGTSRRGISTTGEPDDEEHAARMERREARRRQREKEKAEGRSATRRTSSASLPNSPRAPTSSSSKPRRHSSMVPRSTDDAHPHAEGSKTRSHRSHRSSDTGSAATGTTAAMSESAATGEASEVSGRYRSSRDVSEARRKKPSRRSSRLDVDSLGKTIERTSSGDGDIVQSVSSGDKSEKRRREEARARDRKHSSSRSSRDPPRLERRRTTGDADREERRRSVPPRDRKTSGGEEGGRRRSVPPKKRSEEKDEHRGSSRSSRTAEGAARTEEYRKRREERRLRGDDDYRRRREERLAQREREREQRNRAKDVSRSSREDVSRRSSGALADTERTPVSTSAKTFSPDSTDDASAPPKERALRSFEKKLLDSTGDSKVGSSGELGSGAQAARERLRERMLAKGGGSGQDGEIEESKAQPNALTQSASSSEGGAIPSSRPKLKIKRGGMAMVLKEQRSMVSEDNEKVPSLPESSSESETEEESLPEFDGHDEEISSADDDEESWTIRVSLISAVDLPLNVVPNMPLCPVLKFGLVKLPVGESVKDSDDAGDKEDPNPESLSVVERIEKSGVTSIPRARVRCTGTKILSKRDNGSVEFHEEMRWDNVKRPMHTGLVVELCARAALPPPNMKEMPIHSKAQAERSKTTSLSRSSASSSGAEIPKAPSNGNGMSPSMGADAFQRARERRSKSLERRGQEGSTKPEKKDSTTTDTAAPGTSPSSSAADDDDSAAPAVPGAGLTGMRALWRKGRQQFEHRQTTKRDRDSDDEGESGKATASVAGFVKGGNGAGSNASGMPGGLKGRNVPSLEGENVALRRPKKKRKLNMTEDLRLGSLVIPLTRLPLEKAIQDKEVARIEQWYQLDPVSHVLVPSQNTPTWRGKSIVKPPPRRSPSVQLEISFSPPQVLDDSEDELDDISARDLAILDDSMDERQMEGVDAPSDAPGRPSLPNSRSFSRRAASRSFSRRTANELRQSKKAADSKAASADAGGKKAPEDPVLEPGLIDFICVVGVSNIGDQKDDDGLKGWVKTSPECSLLEQFPPNDEFHQSHGRNVALPNKVEWFCYPEGWKLWRGSEPPSPADLGLESLSSSPAPNVPYSVASFDACLNCTTSFSWFVIASNSDDYGSKNVKTYGAVIKFYAPAPKGIDQTQDDYGQTMSGVAANSQAKRKGASTEKRLWVPLGICLTSNLPIVGVMEAMLLRLCESLAQETGGSLKTEPHGKISSIIEQDVANAIINYQKPIPGVLHCSIPFLSGERLHVTVPPPTGLPALPHGSSVTSVCRLLGSEGLNTMLAALLTECKILVHSQEVSNLALVAEVTTALIYPFYWALPYIPVLPEAMLEFVEAPLSFLVGMPTSSLKLIDPNVLEDVVVIDVDNSAPDYFEGRRSNNASKAPTPLPSSVATKISKAVFRLLREEEEVEEEYGASNFPGARSLPRLESESLAEREFRISVALQVCGLVRGYDDCLFKVSASQPVFNRDKFLRTAPALFENQRGNLPLAGAGNARGTTPRTLSPRSKRFLSILVNCQHFHQFLETLEDEECAFFNEVMYTFDMNDEQPDDRMLGGYGTASSDDSAAHLSKALQKVEDKIPTYRIERQGKKKRRPGNNSWDGGDEEIGSFQLTDPHQKERRKGVTANSFLFNLLQPLCMDPNSAHMQREPSRELDEDSVGSNHSAEGVHSLSVQYLMQLEKGNWHYVKLFDFPISNGENGDGDGGKSPVVQLRDKVKLRDAIGERRYRAWKLAQEQKLGSDNMGARMSEGDIISAEGNPALDLTSLLSSMADDVTSDTSSVTQSTLSSKNSARASTLSPEQQRVADAKDRDVLRRCLERAYEGGQGRSKRSGSDTFFENGRDLIAEAEVALRNPSAQRFLVSVLSQRSRLENQRKRRSISEKPTGVRRQATQTSVSRLETPSFECVVRLCCAMLDACMESKDYEPAYGLLTHTAGFCTVETKDGRAVSTKNEDLSQETGNKVIYMTGRIGLHPIFADLRLWEEVLRLHLKDREQDKTATSGAALIGKANSDLPEYEAAVATLYEMLGFGIPAEELARFATLVSEERGWFDTERGHSLLMLARRLGVRREQGDDGAGSAGDLNMMRGSGTAKGALSNVDSPHGSPTARSGAVSTEAGALEWTEIGWCHPAAPSAVRSQYLQLEGDSEEKTVAEARLIKRSAVTSLASFGSSIVASGGLDGSVFVAHTIQFRQDDNGVQQENNVSGIHLDWGSSGSRTGAVASTLSSMDGEYGVGAVSCLAAAKGAGYRSSALSSSGSANKDVTGILDEEEFLSAMEGCRVVAGTTAGDLRVWSVKDVYAATVLAKKGTEKGAGNSSRDKRVTHGGSGATSAFAGKRGGIVGSITDVAAGSAFSRLKFSLRGRALSGHRGGVSCVDVPSHIYRPDALVTGGADGFIKLWSLRQPTAGRRTNGEVLPGGKTPMFSTSMVKAADTMGQGRASRSGDALSILSGHTGRVLCVKTAWHGDRLLSGGADRTLRIWDLAGSGGKCLHTLSGHLGWVTHAHYWGPNTIVSASTDRSIALWDPRVRRSPLFVLRHHHSPVSDILVGSRTDPLMVSAAGDGTVATWDFRTLSGANSTATEGSSEPSSTEKAPEGETQARAIRTPVATMNHSSEGKGVRQSGSVMLSRGVTQKNTVLSVGVDAIVREWDIASGRLMNQEATGHCDAISSMTTFSDVQNALSSAEPSGERSPNFGGMVTGSWDGTVRMRKFARK